MFGLPTKSIWQYLLKFGWNRCSSFDKMQMLIFNEFGLKMPIHFMLEVDIFRDLTA